MMGCIEETPLHKLTCRMCGKPFEQRTNYPGQYTLCFACDLSEVRQHTAEQTILAAQQVESSRLCSLLVLAERVIEAARHRIDCPHYHSLPSDVSVVEGMCCQAQSEFQAALLEWDRKRGVL